MFKNLIIKSLNILINMYFAKFNNTFFKNLIKFDEKYFKYFKILKVLDKIFKFIKSYHEKIRKIFKNEI